MPTIDVRCPPETEPEVRRAAEINLRKNLLATGMSPVEVETMSILVTGFEGKQSIEVHVTDFALDPPMQAILKETVYLSFHELYEVQLMDGLTRKVISERKRFAHVH